MKIKDRQQVLVAVALGLAVLFAADKLLYGPLKSLYLERAARIVELRKQVAKGTQTLQREQAIRNRWETMRNNTLPNSSSLAEQQLLKAFDFWAQQSRVSIMSITPQWKRDSDDYMSLECRVDAFGRLDTVTRFLYEIENDPMALKLELVEIGSRDNEGQQISLGLQINGLVLNPPQQAQ